MSDPHDVQADPNEYYGYEAPEHRGPAHVTPLDEPVVAPGTGQEITESHSGEASLQYAPIEYRPPGPADRTGPAIVDTRAAEAEHEHVSTGYDEDYPNNQYALHDHLPGYYDIEVFWRWVGGMSNELTTTHADGWARAANLLRFTSLTLRGRADALSQAWQGESARVFLEWIGATLYSLDQWADVATENSSGLRTIAAAIEDAQQNLGPLYSHYRAARAVLEQFGPGLIIYSPDPADNEDWQPPTDLFPDLETLIPPEQDASIPGTMRVDSVDDLLRLYHPRAAQVVEPLANEYVNVHYGKLGQGRIFAGPTNASGAAVVGQAIGINLGIEVEGLQDLVQDAGTGVPAGLGPAGLGPAGLGPIGLGPIGPPPMPDPGAGLPPLATSPVTSAGLPNGGILAGTPVGLTAPPNGPPPPGPPPPGAPPPAFGQLSPELLQPAALSAQQATLAAQQAAALSAQQATQAARQPAATGVPLPTGPAALNQQLATALASGATGIATTQPVTLPGVGPGIGAAGLPGSGVIGAAGVPGSVPVAPALPGATAAQPGGLLMPPPPPPIMPPMPPPRAGQGGQPGASQAAPGQPPAPPAPMFVPPGRVTHGQTPTAPQRIPPTLAGAAGQARRGARLTGLRGTAAPATTAPRSEPQPAWTPESGPVPEVSDQELWTVKKPKRLLRSAAPAEPTPHGKPLGSAG